MTTQPSCPVIKVSDLHSERDPAPLAHSWHEQGGVAQSDEFGGFFAITGYAEVKKAAANARTFSSASGTTLPSVGFPIPALPLEMDPPRHRDFRHLVVPELRPDRVERWEPQIRAVADRCIDQFIESGRAELGADLGHKIPPEIITMFLGLPEEDCAAFVGWTTQMRRSAQQGDVAANRAATSALVGYVSEKIDKARDSAGDDLVHRVANAEIGGSRIDRMDAVGTLITLIVAGHTTTVNGIVSMLWHVAADTRIRDRLLADPSLVPAAVEEALRMDAPTTFMARLATEDATVDGVDIPAGSRVALVYGAANLDGSAFDCPGTFDLDRRAPAHVTFGHGIHRCAGEHLARAEMRITLERVLDRLPDIRLDGEVEFGGETAFNRGPLTLPVTFTARPAGS